MRCSLPVAIAKKVRGLYSDPRDAYQDAWLIMLATLRSAPQPLFLYERGLLYTIVYRRIIDKSRKATIAPIDPTFIIDEKYERALDATKRDLATLAARAGLTPKEHKALEEYADCILKKQKQNFPPSKRKLIHNAKRKLVKIAGTRF